MKGCTTALGAGLGLSLGGGLIYLLMVNETAWIIFLALAMFMLGAVVIGWVLMWQNRQWMKAVFGNSEHPARVTNNVRLPAYPYAPPATQAQAYLPGPEGYGFQVIENPQAASALTDDSPM